MNTRKQQPSYDELKRRLKAAEVALKALQKGHDEMVPSTIAPMGEGRENYTRYQEIFDKSRDGFVMVDASGKIIDANDAYCAMLGYTLEELQALPDFYQITPARWHVWEREEIWLKRLFKEGCSGLYEKEYIRKDGTIFPVELRSYMVCDENGDVDYLWGTVRDITERKQLQHNVQDVNSFLETVVNESPFPLWISDANGTIIRTNRALRKAVNLTDVQLVNHYNVFQDKNLEREGRLEEVRRVFEQFVPTRFQLPWNASEIDGVDSSGGRNLHVDVSLFPVVSDGKLQYVVCQWADITDHVRAEEALRESKARLRLAMESASEGLWEWDYTTGLVTFDQVALRMIGLDDDFSPQPGERWFALIHDEDRPAVEQAFAAYLCGETETYSVEFRLATRDGDYCWVASTAHVVRSDEQGKPLLVVGIHRDITERKRAEEALRAREQRLQAVFNAVDGVPIQGYDKDRRVIFWNPASEVLYGFSRDEAIGSKLEELIIPEEARQAVVEGIQQWHDQGVPISQGEIELLHKSGARLQVHSNHIMITNHRGEKEMFCIDVDLTKIRQIEKRMVSLSAVVENSDNIVVVKDLDLRVVATNQAFAEAAGHATVDTMIGKTDAEIFGVTPDTEPIRSYMEDERRAQTLPPGEYIMREEPVIRPDGTVCTVLTKKYPIYDESGNLLGTGNISTDITERKKAEEALRESERRYATLAANIPGVLFQNLQHSNEPDDDVFTYISPAVRDLFGLTPEEAMRDSSSVWALIHPEDLDGVMNSIKHAVRNGTHWSHDYRVKTIDGRIIWQRGTASHVVQQDGSILWDGIFLDITERKEAEQALSESEAKYRKLFEESVAPVLNTRPDGTIEAANPACEQLLGVERNSLQGSNILNYYANPEDRIEFKRVVNEKEAVRDYPLTFKKKDGALVHCLATLSVGRSADGSDIIGYRGTLRDVTKEEVLQKQLAQAQKMEAVGRLAGGVAHDFNNMLSVVIGHADMILDEMKPGQPFYDDLTEIKKAGTRSADLTRQLLAFARKQTVAPRAIDVNETVENMLKMLQRLIGEAIDMDWIPGDRVWPVKIDPNQIDRILANLCVNARDAIAGVGTVIIETKNCVFEEDYVSDHTGVVPGEYVLLAVSDNGCGMDAETLTHLFEPFYTTKDQGKGTGLGLATIYGVVKQNNGFINVYSEPGQGSTFKVYLPRYNAKAIPPPDKGPDTSAERGHETVLLVEDEPAILRMTTMMLERQGYRVVEAATPGEAVRLATEHAGNIHLLMTDVVMPEMNGRDLARNLLSLYPDMKCLFMSGYTADVIAHQGVLDEGVNFIQKPFSKGVLSVKLREVLGQI